MGSQRERNEQPRPSFRGASKMRTRNLEIPGLVLAHHPGMTGNHPFGTIPFATISPALAATAVTAAPQDTSTAATAQLQCLSSASEVRSKVA